MDRDWDVNPTYESDHLRIDATLSPAILYDMKLPRQVKDQEVALMLSIADHHLDRGLPFVALVRHQRGTGVIAARHRKAFADWLEDRRDALKRDNFAVVIVMPEAIFRAVLRVVYRFRAPPLRTVTTSDVPSAASAVRSELRRMGETITPDIEAFLDSVPR
ncbi:MAG: hypothetical protein JRJ10_06340 [Deltaproteobacteria bacterium]|nr:hypothetical protein [Deltaproteobacteria bacterium]MBW2225240.1 hypothetical protein [Deltaproteobacteria bacterium]MBW2404590.1 hypothetical protein [Deltaproteobacteria bacterium]MBW2548595.1 hypothetical protein [Deltaproteobacteria bacterium]MBW2717728.1 hypothetical protein [Deltaproteobacteria bacterium]